MRAPDILQSLVKERDAWPHEHMSLVLLVMDGVGDVRHPKFRMMTPLEAARTPNLDELAPQSALGRIMPVDYGITPGSGPAHLGLFGYDPREIMIGRGVLESLGTDMDLRAGDIAARCNFCTMDGGVVSDRRAGRPATEVSAPKCEILQREIGRIEDVQVLVQAGKEHRFSVLFRGPGLAEGVNDTDPHEDGNPPHEARAQRPEAEKTARIVRQFQEKALRILAGHKPINGILMRGIAALPSIPGMEERFRLRCAAIATYPMYRGLAKLAGMNLVPTGQTTEDEFRTYVQTRNDFDYHFIHVKGTDAAGEDGNFEQKVAAIQEVDKALPILLGAKPDVLAITGDHSTPCCMKLHSWHPVPLLLYSERCDACGRPRFTEQNCSQGSLGFFLSMHLMSLMLANAQILDKYGA